MPDEWLVKNRECHCMLCDVPDPADADPDFDGTADHIRGHGWSSMAISDPDGLPGWAFSVGLWHSYGSPEVSIFGLLNPDMQHWVNRLGEQIRDGNPLRPDELRRDVLPNEAPVLLRAVHDSWYRDLFGWAIGFYTRPPLPIVQAVWPDRHGLFPWEDGSGAACRADQPWLWLPKDKHPKGLWTNLDALTPWPFPVPANTTVATLTRIVHGDHEICGIVHDEEHRWQFLDGGPIGETDVVTTHFHHLLIDHPHLAQFADLPPGHQAWLQPDGTWERTLLT